MDSSHYTKNEAGWQLHKDGKAKGAPFDKLSIVYVRPKTPEFVWTLKTHGEFESIQEWYRNHVAELSGKDEFGRQEAQQLWLYHGDFDEVELNRCIATPSYVERMLRKLQGLEIEVSSMDPESENDFFVAVDLLKEAQGESRGGRLTSVQFAAQRGHQLGLALLALASGHGVKLRSPLYIDSRGEFSIVAESKNHGFANPNQDCGAYGVDFAKILNAYGPRCGQAPGARLTRDNGWCSMKHFSVEKLVMDQYELRQANRQTDAQNERITERA